MGEAKRKRMAQMARSGGDSGAFAGMLRSTGIPQANQPNPDEITLAGIHLLVPGSGIGHQIRALWERDTLAVLMKHGPAAFECTREAAAIHEAGHVVVYAAHGMGVESTRIEHDDALGGGWIGYTQGAGSEIRIQGGEGETEALYLHRARFLMAGVTAERLFDPDCRPGSSIDEIVMADVMSMLAARLGGIASPDGSQRYFQASVRDAVTRLLLQHEKVVREIALHLFDHGSADRAKLEQWCRPILETAA